MFSGLSPKTDYSFRFQWKASPNGAWTQVLPNATCRTKGVVAAPRVTCGASTDRSISVSWDPIAGADANKFQIKLGTGEWETPTGTTHAFSGLSPSTTYTVQVEAGKGDDWGDPGKAECPTAAVPASSLATPEVDCGAVSSSSVAVSWGSVEHAARYRYRATPGSTGWTTATDSVLEASFSNLSAFTSHTVEVQPGTAGEWSDNTGSAVCTTISDPVATGGKYRVLKEVYEGVHHSASLAVDQRDDSCASYTDADAKKRLAAIMLSIPVHEVLGGFTSTGSVASAAGHPMILSRSDTLSRSDNIRFFSHLRVGGYQRAFWNPGVGLWQLDILNDEVLRLNHAERIDPSLGGLEAAKHLLEKFCVDSNPYLTSTSGTGTFDRWVACKKDNNEDEDDEDYENIPDCYESYVELYNSGGAFKVHVLNQATSGAIEERKCRWGDAGEEVVCYLFDTNPYSETTGCGSSFWAGGSVRTVSKCSNGSVSSSNLRGFTPLAASFVSLTSKYMEGTEGDPWRYSTRYAVWPAVWPATSATMIWPTESVASAEGTTDPCLAGSDSCITLIKAVPRGVKSRVSPKGTMSLSVPANVNKHCSEDLGASRTIPCNRFTAYTGTIDSETSHGPEGWYDDTIDYDNSGTSRDLQVYDCKLVDLTGVQCRFVSVNKPTDAESDS